MRSNRKTDCEGAMRLNGEPFNLTKVEKRFGIAAGALMFLLAILAALL